MIGRIGLSVLCLLGVGCTTGPRVAIVETQTLSGLGAGQALALVDDKLLAMGDAETGIIREYTVDADRRILTASGRSIRLTRQGDDILSHPTGMAHHQTHGTFVGDTVRRRGTIWHIDLPKAWQDGNLDRAVLRRVDDTAAVNGSRPEFVEFGGRWVVASSDYGPLGNQIRLMDPTALARASTTAEPGVVVARLPATAWVQQLHWVHRRQTLILVQNQVAGLRYRLTFITGLPQGRPKYAVVDLPAPRDELEGFVMLDDSTALMLSSSREDNLHWVRVQWPR